MPKKAKRVKMPLDDNCVIYGILHLTSNKLVKVDLDEKNIWFEFDMGMYNENEYKIIKIQISLKG
jgi:hypothetical protein